MKSRAFLLLLFLLITVKSWSAGLIGKTYEDCAAQLGAPAKHVETGAKVITDLYTFQQGTWSIEIGFWKGVVHLVSYKRTDGKALTPAETTALMTGFSDSFSWAKDTSGSYHRSDGLVKAKPTSSGLTFLSTELARSL